MRFFKEHYTIICLLSLVFLLASCGKILKKQQAKLRSMARYGVEYDSVRAELGIPTILEGWRIVSIDKHRERYIKDEQYPCHHWKYVLIDEEGQIEKEIDEYYSGQEFFDEVWDAYDLFKLEVIYDYKAEGEKMSYMYTDPGNYNRENMPKVEITKEQADSLLASWGISYDG